MAVPKKRHSKGRTRRRAAHHAIPAQSLAKCARCSQTIRPHTVCGNCGHYRGKLIVDMEEAAS